MNHSGNTSDNDQKLDLHGGEGGGGGGELNLPLFKSASISTENRSDFKLFKVHMT